jgi:hypothetical protein
MSILFWGLVVAMSIAAIAFIVFPLEAGKRRIRSPQILLAALIPPFAISLYVALGTPSAIFVEARQTHQGQASSTDNANTGNLKGIPTVASLIDGLEARLQLDADDGAGWLLLARSYEHVGRRSDALAAYSHAKSLGNSHAELEKVLGAFGSISGEVAEDPTPAIHGRLMLSPEVAIQVRQSDTIFIFAKESTEQRMPVAALRKSVADLPLEFVLSDDQTMVPGTHLADYKQLIVTARVSRSGKAGDTLNDFETTSAPVSPSNGDKIELLITANVTNQGSSNE